MSESLAAATSVPTADAKQALFLCPIQWMLSLPHMCSWFSLWASIWIRYVWENVHQNAAICIYTYIFKRREYHNVFCTNLKYCSICLPLQHQLGWVRTCFDSNYLASHGLALHISPRGIDFVVLVRSGPKLAMLCYAARSLKRLSIPELSHWNSSGHVWTGGNMGHHGATGRTSARRFFARQMTSRIRITHRWLCSYYCWIFVATCCYLFPIFDGYLVVTRCSLCCVFLSLSPLAIWFAYYSPLTLRLQPRFWLFVSAPIESPWAMGRKNTHESKTMKRRSISGAPPRKSPRSLENPSILSTSHIATTMSFLTAWSIYRPSNSLQFGWRKQINMTIDDTTFEQCRRKKHARALPLPTRPIMAEHKIFNIWMQHSAKFATNIPSLRCEKSLKIDHTLEDANVMGILL